MKIKSVPILLMCFFSVLIWSAVRPHDYFTWFLEVLPAIVGFVILFATYSKFQFTTLVYILILLHAIILMIGGHYTYAQEPIFNWLKDFFGWKRNYYDRLGHFSQGFVPALIVRELLLRTSPLKRGKWLISIVLSVCLAISVLYELFEWLMSVLTGTAADAFLGTQGDVWDTQWDMMFALMGAITALLFFARLHDKCLKPILK